MHPEKFRLELLRAGGASLDSLAEKFKPLSRDAIHRHWTKCVHKDAKASYLCGPAQMEQLHAKAAAEGESVLDYFKILRTALMSSLTACSEAGDARGVALVSNSLVGVLERLGKITGEISTIAGSVTVNNNLTLVNSPAFARVQAAILRALAGHSAARVAVIEALRELDAEPADAPVKPSRAPLLIEHEPLTLSPPPY
jgi:hypothetical protein